MYNIRIYQDEKDTTGKELRARKVSITQGVVKIYLVDEKGGKMVLAPFGFMLCDSSWLSEVEGETISLASV